jgi:hypothetical protein
MSQKPAAKPSSSPKAPNTPPSTPALSFNQVISLDIITPNHIQQFLHIFKEAIQGTSNSGTKASPSKEKEEKTKLRIRASKPNFTTAYQWYAQCVLN